MTVKWAASNELVTNAKLHKKNFRGTYAEEYALNACKLAGCECTGSAVAEAEPVIQAVTDAATVSTTEAQGAICDAAQFAYDNVKYDTSERDIWSCYRVSLSGARLPKTRPWQLVKRQNVIVNR